MIDVDMEFDCIYLYPPIPSITQKIIRFISCQPFLSSVHSCLFVAVSARAPTVRAPPQLLPVDGPLPPPSAPAKAPTSSRAHTPRSQPRLQPAKVLGGLALFLHRQIKTQDHVPFLPLPVSHVRALLSCCAYRLDPGMLYLYVIKIHGFCCV